MLDEIKKKWLAGALVLGLILGFWGGQQYAKWQMGTKAVTVVSGTSDLEESLVEPLVEQATIAVHVAGAVEKPGVYQLAEGQRVEDALVLARVLPEGLVDEYLNRAALLSDGEKIVVPSATDLSLSPGNPMPAPFLGGTSQDKGLVNINQAGLGDLTKLPGIGDVKGQAILDYRQANGRFSTIEELKKVKGIGEKTYDGLKDLVSV